MWIKFLWIIGIAWISQGILAYYQIANLQKVTGELKKYGRLGIGTVKGRLRGGVIVAIAVNDDDVITHARIMKGITVFARFSAFNKLENLRLKDVGTISKEFDKKLQSAILKAIDSIRQQKSTEESDI